VAAMRILPVVTATSASFDTPLRWDRVSRAMWQGLPWWRKIEKSPPPFIIHLASFTLASHSLAKDHLYASTSYTILWNKHSDLVESCGLTP
jgi:hypothetical protein